VVSAGDMHGGSSIADNLDEDNDQLLVPPMSLTEDDRAEPYEGEDEPQESRLVV